MDIWLVTIGEPLPTDGPHERLLRAGILAQTLTRRGHRVTWWTSDFDHQRKRHRFGTTAETQADGISLVLLHGVGYRHHVSVARFLDHRQVTRQFSVLSRAKPPPDIIVASLPPIDLCHAAVRYGRGRGVPVLVDLRDQWPDLFLDVMPRALRFPGRLVLAPMYWSARKACAEATGLVGITDDYLRWGLQKAGRDRRDTDSVSCHGYSRPDLSAEEATDGLRYWQKKGVEPSDRFRVCFFGTFGRQFDIDTLIAAARLLEDRSPGSFQFVLCGKGDNLASYQRKASDCKALLLPGWVDARQIAALASLSDAGIAPYRNAPNFWGNLPNKPIEYMSFGLPIVTPLAGCLSDLISSKHVGWSYEEGNPGSLAAVLTELRADPQVLRQCSQAAVECYEADLKAENVYRAYASHVESVALMHREHDGSS